MKLNYYLTFVLLFAVGCVATKSAPQGGGGRQVTVTLPKDMNAETAETLQRIANEFQNQEISNEDLKRFEQEISRNPEAADSVEKIKDSLTNQKTTVKYCPVDGKRFSAKFTECPDHRVPLKTVE